MPVYNGERWIEATIGSLQRQTFADFELIISDNASEDRTGEICTRMAAADARIRYVRNARNIGANRNYVAVLALARASYFKWASSNDLCEPRFLECCVRVLDERPDVVLAYPRASVFVEGPAEATPYDHDFGAEDDEAVARFRRVLECMQLNNAINGVIRTAALRKALPMGSFWSADVVLMAELALMGKFALLPERLFLRRMSEASATRLRAAREVELHFEPEATHALRWQNWKFYKVLLHAAVRSAPAGVQWFKVVAHALRAMRWARAALLSDVMTATRRLA